MATPSTELTAAPTGSVWIETRLAGLEQEQKQEIRKLTSKPTMPADLKFIILSTRFTSI